MADGRARSAPTPRVGRRTSRRPRLSLRVYLLGLVVAFALLGVALVAVQRGRILDNAQEATQVRADFQAELAARSIVDALELSKGTVAELAANPGIVPLFGAGGAPSGCSLLFSGAGPFTRGHIDVVSADGSVRCSSRDQIPAPGVYRDAPWLDVTESAVVGPVRDAVTSAKSLVAASPVDGLGVVAMFLVLSPVGGELEDRFGGPLTARFRLLESEGRSRGNESATNSIVGAAPIRSLGWTVEARFDRDDALADAESLNRQLVSLIVAGTALLLVATQLIYRRLARPIQHLSASVRTAMTSGAPETVPAGGPAEVASLAESFSVLWSDMAAELARRQQAEREARASEESYRLLFAANPLPMWIYDVETLAFLEVNRAAVQTYGYRRDEFLAMTIRDIRPPDDLDALMESVATAPEIDRSGPWRHILKDGSIIEVEITSHPVTFAQRPARFVMSEDVTHRERAQRLLLQARRMESLGQLAGGIAHDFNNILAVLLNYAEFAAEGLENAAERDGAHLRPILDDVEQITAASRRAADLTHQLLAFSRGDSVEVAPVDLNHLVSGLEHMLRRTLGEHIDVDVSLADGLPPVVANAGQLEQVILNLAVNARDAMSRGGRLSIETANVDLDENHQLAQPDIAPGRYVRLRVSDTGEGMSAEVRDRAFEPFFTTKDRGSGTGFGLATVYGIVTRAGGSIRIYSERGLGTSVTVLLPPADAVGSPLSEPAARSQPSTGAETVLIVEDDESVRAVAERILSEAGYGVLTAPDGDAALMEAARRPREIDLVLTDVVMPGMLGSELIARLRESHPHLRVLLMSGYAPPVLVAGGNLAAGAPLVEKPFSADALRQKVREALDAGPPSEHRADVP